MLEFKCKCRQKIKVDDKHAGKSGKCPKCKQIIEIPLATIVDIEPQASDASYELKKETKECPCCGEDILETAKKCKHCGEWLVVSDERKGAGFSEKGTSDARAITKGLKEKEFHDITYNTMVWVILAISISLGLLHWIIGVTVFLVLICLLGKWYYKE